MRELLDAESVEEAEEKIHYGEVDPSTELPPLCWILTSTKGLPHCEPWVAGLREMALKFYLQANDNKPCIARLVEYFRAFESRR